MKRQNGIALTGKLLGVRASRVTARDPSAGSEPALNTVKGQAFTGSYVSATLVTDHLAYGGHHYVLFTEEHAADVLAYWALTDGNLDVAIEGWLRSTPGTDGGPPVAVVVVDRVIYLTVTDAMRELVGRHKAGARSGQSGGKRGAAQRAG